MIDEGQRKSVGRILDRLDPKTTNALSGFFIGLTICVLAGWFLQQIGVLYIHTRGESFQQFKEFNDTIADTRSIVDNGVQILKNSEARVKQAIADGQNLSKSESRFVNITELFPDLKQKISKNLPYNSSIILMTSKDGGYKILTHSELCSATAFERPELVDRKRDRYGLFCRYFDYWNDAGKNL